MLVHGFPAIRRGHIELRMPSRYIEISQKRFFHRIPPLSRIRRTAIQARKRLVARIRDAATKRFATTAGVPTPAACETRIEEIRTALARRVPERMRRR